MMQPIKLTAIVDEKRRILLDLPDEVPVGKVEVLIRPLETPSEAQSLTREEARAKLIAAGLISPNTKYAPDDAEELSEEEEERLSKLFTGDRPAEDYINEDREERF